MAEVANESATRTFYGDHSFVHFERHWKNTVYIFFALIVVRKWTILVVLVSTVKVNHKPRFLLTGLSEPTER